MRHRDDYLPGLLAALPDRIEDIIPLQAARMPAAIAVVAPGTVLAYGQLAAAVSACRSYLAEAGLRSGDRLLIIGENDVASVALLFAASGLRAWPVLANGRLSAGEIDAIRAHAAPRLTVFVSRHSPMTRSHAARLQAQSVELPRVGTVQFGAVDDAAVPEPPALADDVAVLLYTSGSTGQPKGVMLTHRNLLQMAAISGAIRGLTPLDRFLAILPLSHIVCLAVLLLGALLHGASIDLRTRFLPDELLAALRDTPVSILLGTPAMYTLLLDYARRKGIDALAAPSLRIISVSGAPLDPTVKQVVERFFGLKLHHGYGITECSPTIAQVRPEAPRDDCAVGPLIPGLEARLVDGAGVIVPPGQVGELQVRGATVMKGYYKAPDETRLVLDGEGWFRTGDLVRIEEGCLTIVGRAKEMIIRFGFNVYPAEIEAALMQHPAVLQAAVVGRMRNGGEEIVAFVRRQPQVALTGRDLMTFLAPRLTSYKQPSEIVLVDEMPVTSSGKILKSALADAAQGVVS